MHRIFLWMTVRSRDFNKHLHRNGKKYMRIALVLLILTLASLIAWSLTRIHWLMIAGEVLFILFYLVMCQSEISSVRGMLCALLVNSFIFSFFVVSQLEQLMQRLTEGIFQLQSLVQFLAYILFVVIYFFVWTFFSLVADEDSSKLANSIMGTALTLFTAIFNVIWLALGSLGTPSHISFNMALFPLLVNSAATKQLFEIRQYFERRYLTKKKKRYFIKKL